MKKDRNKVCEEFSCCCMNGEIPFNKDNEVKDIIEIFKNIKPNASKDDMLRWLYRGMEKAFYIHALFEFEVEKYLVKNHLLSEDYMNDHIFDKCLCCGKLEFHGPRFLPMWRDDYFSDIVNDDKSIYDLYEMTDEDVEFYTEDFLDIFGFMYTYFSEM